MSLDGKETPILAEITKIVDDYWQQQIAARSGNIDMDKVVPMSINGIKTMMIHAGVKGYEAGYKHLQDMLTVTNLSVERFNAITLAMEDPRLLEKLNEIIRTSPSRH